jgi:hypothetical protein
MDFMLVASSAVAGGVASAILNGLLLNKGFGISKEKSKLLDSVSELELGELESLKIEKSILEECISKIYHAYSTNVISKLEYDRLQARYGEEIRICNERLVSLQSTVDLAELHDLKKDLLSLIESKIKMIDEKLNSFSSSSSVLMPDDESLSDYLTIKPREFGTQIKRTIALEHSKIKNVQKEVLDAVADLDKPSNTFTDPEPKETKALENKEETSSTPNKAKKDALNNLP